VSDEETPAGKREATAFKIVEKAAGNAYNCREVLIGATEVLLIFMVPHRRGGCS
jgi:hypothetical protein